MGNLLRLFHSVKRLRRRPTRFVHRGADETYGPELAALRHLPVADELVTELEAARLVHLELNQVEEKMRALIDATFAEIFTQFGISEAEALLGTDATFDEVRELVATP